MNRLHLWKFSATAAMAIAAAAVPSISVNANGGEAGAAQPERAARAAERAEQAIERGRSDRALRFAEEAVSYDPQNAAHRTTLGQAYMMSGRFLSAAESFNAARQLGATDSRTLIGQALSFVAIGRNSDAVQLLDANMSGIPASDYGLALALAGEGPRGALVLIDVVRAPDATARDRQNLALAFAAAGRWLEAQLMAAQDVGGQVATQRVEQWAAMLQAGDPRMRIAGVMGVTPVEDAGMPVALALNDAPAANVQLARNDDPAPLGLYAPRAPGEAAAAEVQAEAPSEAPVQMAMADVPAAEVAAAPAAPAAEAAAEAAPVADPVREVAPVSVGAAVDAAEEAPAAMPEASNPVVRVATNFVSIPVIQPLRDAVSNVMASLRVDAPAAAAPAPRPVRVAAAAPTAAEPAARTSPRGPVRTTGWAVQLGAYDSNAIARDNWSRLARRHAALGARDGVSTVAQVNGRTFYRLAATGYASRAEAVSACASVASVGGNCFVRQMTGADRVQWASRPLPTRVAAANRTAGRRVASR
jgi:D-alanyl-D-alanine carboxypeptidase